MLASSTLAGCFLLPKEEEVLGPPLMKPPEVKYNVIEVERQNMEQSVSIYGHLVPAVQKELFFRYHGGRLVDLYVELDDWIEQGAILAEIDIEENLPNKIEQKKILIEKAKIKYDNLKNLHESNIVANASELRLAELDIRLAELQLQDLQKTLAGTRLTAPISGLITYIDAKEGQYIDAFKIVIKLVNPDKLIFEYNGSERTEFFRFGMLVEVKVKGELCPGKVIMTPLDAPDDATEEERERILIDVSDLPNDAVMNDIATVKLVLDSRDNAVAIPKDLIHQYSGRSYVYILNEGLKEERSVELGMQTSTEVEIVKGLEAGEQVIKR